MYAIRSYYEEPRAELKPHAPRIEKIEIPKDMIGAVIGPGGKVIQEIQEISGTVITIEEVGNRITSYNVCYTKLLRFAHL